MKRQFGVLGAGRFGQALAITLSELGSDVIVVDANADTIQEIANQVTSAVQADIADVAALRSIGLQNVDVVIVAVTSDINASIMGVINAQELKIPTIYAKAISPQHEKVLYKLGVDKVWSPEQDMGERIARQLHGGRFIDMLELDTQHSIVEIDILPSWAGQSLGDLDLRKNCGINVIAIHSKDQLNISPAAQDRIKMADKLIVLGETTDINKIQNDSGK